MKKGYVASKRVLIFLFIFVIYIYLVRRGETRVRACTRKSEDNLKKPVLSFYHVSPEG